MQNFLRRSLQGQVSDKGDSRLPTGTGNAEKAAGALGQGQAGEPGVSPALQEQSPQQQRW